LKVFSLTAFFLFWGGGWEKIIKSSQPLTFRIALPGVVVAPDYII